MKVVYNTNVLIAGIGVTPWTRLGPEQWLQDYRIVSYRDGGATGMLNMPPVHLLGEVELTKKNTQQMIRTDAFKQSALNGLKDYSFITYKPVVVDDPQLEQRFLMNDPGHTRTFENKAWLREAFGAELPFAPFVIVRRADLQADEITYEKLRELCEVLVMQHEQLSGGKGTYIVRNFADFCAALAALPEDGKIVISAYLSGAQERSVQCVVTQRYGTLYGGLQKQIVRDPYVCNLATTVVNGFGGGEIGTLATTPARQKIIAECVEKIGQRMKEEGFKGIFGIDFMIRGGEVFLLEINARLTGLTPLLTMMYRPGLDIPFYLIHTLELAGEPYTISAGQQRPDGQPAGAGGMLVLQSQQSQSCRLDRTLSSGVYTLRGEKLVLVRRDIHFAPNDPADAVLVQSYVTEGTVVKPAERLITAMVRQPVLNTDDELNDFARQLVSSLYAGMLFRPM
jgi:hypothetical protein